jgi:hypothetical protein
LSRLSKKPELLVAFAKRKSSGNIARNDVAYSLSPGRVKGTRVFDYEAKAVLLYEDPSINSRSSFLGLRGQDFPGLVWELAPLSFVVDRIVNIKRFLDVASAMTFGTASIRGGCVVTKISDKKSWTLVDLPVSGIYTFSPRDYPPYTEIDFSYQRVKWEASITDAAPRLKPLGVIDSAHKLADTASLILSYLRVGR